MQRDPVGYKAGINLYSYCDNNSINFSDPSGLSKEFLKGFAWGVGETLVAVVVGGAIIYIAIQLPPLAFLLTQATPWLLGVGALYGGTQIGQSIGGVGWGGQSLSPRERGERLGIGTLTAGAAILGAANVSKPIPKNQMLQTYYPPNRGFSGKPTPVTLQPGTVIDRYGGTGGTFVSPQGTPIGARSLPPGSQNKPLNAYQVLKPLKVDAGTTSSWFGQPGGGTQYDLGATVQELLGSGYLGEL